MDTQSKGNIAQTLKVAKEQELLHFLCEQKVKGSRTAVKSLLTHDLVQVNGKAVRNPTTALQSGDVVTIHKVGLHTKKEKLNGITVIYEDEYLLVINKEAGILSINSNSEQEKTAYKVLSDYVKKQSPNNKIFILHRLDRETSGTMVFARSKEVQEALQKDWDTSIVQRSYLAVVSGQPNPPEGIITSWLTEDKNFLVYACKYDNGGKKAITRYKTLKSGGARSLLQLDLETGRKNQIRVQLESIGHSILGDKKYGSLLNPIKRVALHAATLSFIHPISKKTLSFHSEVPKIILNLLPNQTHEKDENN